METIDFKKIFGGVAKNYGFERAYEGWFKEFPEVIQVLDLQKSNFGNYYYLNIKIFIQGVFGNEYIKNKKLVKNEVGNIFLRQPDEYSASLDLEAFLKDNERIDELQKMFHNFIAPLSEKTSSKDKIKDLYSQGDFFILPAVKKELGL